MFDNEACQSQSKNGMHYHNGTCYTDSECTEKGGTAQGNCAAGFGVCCVFSVDSGDVTQNNTYLTNLNYPQMYNGNDSTITYEIEKCESSKYFFIYVNIVFLLLISVF